MQKTIGQEFFERLLTELGVDDVDAIAAVGVKWENLDPRLRRAIDNAAGFIRRT